jgi:hypothetical protein
MGYVSFSGGVKKVQLYEVLDACPRGIKEEKNVQKTGLRQDFCCFTKMIFTRPEAVFWRC